MKKVNETTEEKEFRERCEMKRIAIEERRAEKREEWEQFVEEFHRHNGKVKFDEDGFTLSSK